MLYFKYLAKSLILIGGFIILIGIGFLLVDKIPFIGRLPGDIYLQRKNFVFYFPLTTCILLSILLSFILWIILRR